MITKVTISEGFGADDYEAVLYGDLAAILNACAQAKLSKSGGSQLPDELTSRSQLSVVAGA